MRLSPHFHLSEFTKSQTAARHGIRNKPTAKQIQKLRVWCEMIGEPVRKEFGPVIISSGYRSPQLNSIIGGSPTSQHSKGEAADFEVVGVSNLEVARWINQNLLFDQLILEFWDGENPNSGWVHCSYTEDRIRAEALQAIRRSGRVHYVRGLP